MNIKKILSAAVLLTASVVVHAGVIVGGSTLLSNDGLSQLENWLGEGELTLTNIFTKTSEATSYDFHNAADGKGRTFTLMSASQNNNVKTIGGYNPLSWDSSGSYHMALGGFIFNLTDSVLKTQPGYFGNIYQTYNTSSYGPTFGGGHDIYVDTSLSNSYSFGYSYGNDYGKSIVDGSQYIGQNIKIDALEVFTIGGYTSNAVPEPMTVALLGIGLLGVAASRRKSANSKNA